jgi:hypothetical protein
LVLHNPAFSADNEVSNDSAVYAWTVSKHGELGNYIIDTNLQGSFYFNPLNENNSFYAFTGNLGGPAINMIFNERLMPEHFFRYKTYEPYLFNYDNAVFYNTKKPYSEFKYSTNTGGKTKNENLLSLLHTQNVNKYFNVGVHYKLVNVKGYYNNQQTNNNSFRLFSSYTNNRLNVYFDGVINNLKVQDNGGVVVDSTFLNSSSDPKNYQTILNDARSQVKSKSLSFSASYKLGTQKQIVIDKDTIADTNFVFKPLFEFGYKLFYDNFSIRYRDEKGDLAYYDYMVSNNGFQDSVFESRVDNRFDFKMVGNDNKFFSPSVLFGYSYLYNDHKQVLASYNPLMNDVLESTAFIDQSVYSEILSKNNKIYYKINGKYVFSGYEEGDITGSVNLERQFNSKDTSVWGGVYFDYDYVNKTPGYFLNRYIGNTAFWLNDFDNTEIHLFNIGLNSSKYNFDLSFRYSMNKNYVFFNNNIVPEQKEDLFYSNSISLTKDFYFWKMVSSTKYVNQMATAVAKVPQHLVRSTLMFDDQIFFKSTGGSLGIQVGATVTWFSEYSIYTYSPDLNTFYVQNNVKYGAYPYLDAFINARIKSFRLFLKMTNILASDKNKEYFTIYPYPQNPRVFRFGVAWLFYN